MSFHLFIVCTVHRNKQHSQQTRPHSIRRCLSSPLRHSYPQSSKTQEQLVGTSRVQINNFQHSRKDSIRQPARLSGGEGNSNVQLQPDRVHRAGRTQPPSRYTLKTRRPESPRKTHTSRRMNEIIIQSTAEWLTQPTRPEVGPQVSGKSSNQTSVPDPQTL